MTRLETLQHNLLATFGETASLKLAYDELTLEINAKNWIDACTVLRDNETLGFDTCIDLCGIDYSGWGAPTLAFDPSLHAQRFAVVLHLLSVQHNWRLRVRVYVPNDEFPVIASLVDVWPAVNWYEREAFDLFGIVFDGHPDLRRILTDYGFIGHPFRKDFPLSGNVEMRYDTEQQRVVYQPVTIEPRVITPRVVREDGYGAGR
ncbi:NADH-quinone oxidoreductase subunit C [Allopusillimonas ginsengisoli]|uniref:NADH-quinone oxidoreductase subunit C n=1 Tax=Allopusillimonas ginsengisoli TaxID=453575 RepID=UPI00101FA940|nr:NADH-quinone oxidoreductase subunit C [Allopusillimonas ginsengisoli]TEA78582.1 NADH-quinone oxidoreductase subunit C [Allopusillimonas ginsengisoli]